MCTGAIINSRIKKVVFALKEEKFGAIISRIKIENFKFNHKFDYEIDSKFSEEVKLLMQNFFKNKR
jgi:tRNA(adenine34) deaminase